MLMTIYASLRQLRPNHVNLTATHSFWHWHLQHLHRSIYGQHLYKLGARHYVQAPEARPIPDETSLPGLQHQQQQQRQQQVQQQQEQQREQQQETVNLAEQGDTNSSDKPPQNQDSQSRGRPSSSENMSSGVKIPYNIDWIFPRMRNPTKFWYITSQIVITLVGLFSKFIIVLLNKTRVHNRDRLVLAINKRPKGTPLLTVSNHYSCFDDPGIWGMLPLHSICNTWRLRWSMAAHDICFTKKSHSMFFMYGKCIPVVRGIGVYQEAINLCIEKCALGHWVHIFPEGRVNQDKENLRLKWGVGRIIYESPRLPIVLPLWHEGMETVLPNVEPYRLKWGKKVTINIGQPLDLNDFVQKLKDQQVPEPVARKLITDKIQDAFRILRDETEKLHGERG